VSFSSASFWGFDSDHILQLTRRRFETAHFTPVCRTMPGFFDLGSQEAVCGGAEEVNPAAASQKRIGLLSR
jgi:hypothetical protein